jgi:hypothetical protein
MTTACVRPQCGRPTDGIAYACQGCANKAREQLEEIGELLPAAMDAALGQTSHGQHGGNGTYGPREELRLAAKDRLDKSRGLLGTWVRHIAPQREDHLPHDTLDAIAQWLIPHLEWARGKRWAEEFLADIEACAGVIRGVTAGPRERRYLGPCGAERWVSDPGDDEFGADVECDGAVYGGIGGKWATCKDCGARYDQAARIAERVELAHSHWYTAAEIAEAHPGVVLAGTIRQWRKRGLLQSHGEYGGHRVYAVAEVLALVESGRERQAGQQRRETAEMGA